MAAKSIYSESYERFLSLLIDARKNAGLTQQQLAGLLKRPQSYVSKYERGERRLDVIEFLNITKILNVEPASILRKLLSDSRRARARKSGV